MQVLVISHGGKRDGTGPKCGKNHGSEHFLMFYLAFVSLLGLVL